MINHFVVEIKNIFLDHKFFKIPTLLRILSDFVFKIFIRGNSTENQSKLTDISVIPVTHVLQISVTFYWLPKDFHWLKSWKK